MYFDAFVKGRHRKRIWFRRNGRGPGGGAEKGTKCDDCKMTSYGKGAVNKFDGTCRNCAKYGENVLYEQENAGEHADKDIEGLSNALCTVSFNVMSDEIEDDWTDAKKRAQVKKESRS